MRFEDLEVGQKFRFWGEGESVVHMKIRTICLSARTKHKPNYVVLSGRTDVGTASDANPEVRVESL